MKKFLTIDDLIEFCMKNNFSKFSSKESNAEISVQMPAVATFGKSDDDKHTEGLCPFNATAYHDHVNLNKSNINEDTFQENTHLYHIALFWQISLKILMVIKILDHMILQWKLMKMEKKKSLIRNVQLV